MVSDDVELCGSVIVTCIVPVLRFAIGLLEASISLFEGNITPIYDLKRREVAVLEGYARNRATQLHSRSCHNRPYSLSF
uniref:Uncharacterized protein n=1 Tax=Physcomitrium patens TaxID=3218 RepID=A0A2K1KTJ7_PHYPA|nr:hypothetical protein PHYPA_004095 [Physcomitrium patens]